MYLSFYKLKEFPFSLSCDERYFYESAAHTEALANMMYTVQQRKGMVLVTGEVGAGKTFVGSMLSARLGSGCLTVAMTHPPQSGKQLLRAVAAGVGINVKSSIDELSLVEELLQQLTRVYHRGRLVALILDECQDLTAASLEEIRLLWNWEEAGQRLIQIVLIGQPELRERLQEAQWEPLRQRIVLSYHLSHLSQEETYAYIDHRIKVASEDGCEAKFTPAAKAEIYAATSGIPRLINILCDNSLLVGYTQAVQSIDRPIVASVLKDMTCWGLQVSRQSTEPPNAPGLRVTA